LALDKAGVTYGHAQIDDGAVDRSSETGEEHNRDVTQASASRSENYTDSSVAASEDRENDVFDAELDLDVKIAGTTTSGRATERMRKNRRQTIASCSTS